MKCASQFEEIELGRLADDGQTGCFSFSYPLEDRRLLQSIDDFGLLHPICVRKYNARWQVVFGAKRLIACRTLGWKSIAARTIRQNEITEEQALLLSLEEDLHTRQLNAVECAGVLHKFKTLAGWSPERLVAELAPRLRLPQNRDLLKNYLAIATIEDRIKQKIAAGDLSPAHAFLLLEIPQEERAAVFNLIIEECAPSLSELREIVEHLLDLKALLKDSIPAILKQPEFAYLGSERAAPGKKCALLRHQLKQLRFPHLSKFETRFDATRNRLKDGNKIRINHAPYFEQNHLYLSFKAADHDELSRVIKSLQELAESKEMKELFKIARGEN